MEPSEDRQQFKRLQEGLIDIWQRIQDPIPQSHTSVMLPSLSMDPEELGKVQGVSLYEERLLCGLIRLRHPRARMIYLSSQPIHPGIIDYYLQVLVGVPARHASKRLHMLCVYDSSPRALTAKILERPRLIERIRELMGPPDEAYLTCFNSTELERELALKLGIPLNGVDPDLLDIGTKSGSRKAFVAAGVDLPAGFQDLPDGEAAVDALARLWVERRPRRVVVKLNEAFAGTGNAIVTLPLVMPEDPVARRAAADQAFTDAAWSTADQDREYFDGKLAEMGGIVEEMVEVEDLASPSVQLRINPDLSLEILSTHDQVLGGATGQSYLGCRFPANEAYREMIQQQALAIGEVLRERGVVSRFGIDFLVGRSKDGEGGWKAWAIEINLRMGGTTHPFLALEFLTGGKLRSDSGDFFTPAGTRKFYYATDNLLSPAYRGLLPDDFMDILTVNKLHFDPTTGTGALFHMIGAMPPYGKVGVTCIANSLEEADRLYGRIVEVLDDASAGSTTRALSSSHPFDLPLPRME